MPQYPSSYVHGTAPQEQRRLGRMNRILNERALAELRLRGGERVLDLGSGLGQFTRAMARAAGRSGHVIGIERSAEQLAEASRLAAEEGEAGLVDLRQGDALDPPLRKDEWGSFDVVHTRFLLEHVPDPLAVVCVMARAVRPGGRVVLADDDHELMRFWPEVPDFETLWRTYWTGYTRAGNDPLIGRKLVALLHEAGLRPLRNHWLFFGSCSGMPDWADVIENLAGVLESARETVLATSDFSAERFDAALAALRAWSRRPDAALWYPLCWAEAVKPC